MEELAREKCEWARRTHVWNVLISEEADTIHFYFAGARTALDLGRPFGPGLGDCASTGGGTEDAVAATAATAADGGGGGKVGVGRVSGFVTTREQGMVSASTAVEGRTVEGTAHGDDKVGVAGDSISWSKGPSGRAIIAAEAGKVAGARPSVVAWTAMAPVRVNGATSGRGEGLSVAVRSVVA